MDFKKIIQEQRKEIEEKIKKERIIKREALGKAIGCLRYPNILAVLGVRRCGKSIFSWQVFENTKFAYVDFSDERLEGITVKDMNRILLSLYSLYGKSLENIIFDEIHEVKGWEKFVSRLRIRHRIVITGSNSKMLSGELATYLTGRHINLYLFPFSFREVLNYKDIRYRGVLTTREEGEILSNLEEYLELGGFPERFLFGKTLLRQIYEDIIIKDVVLRAGIKKVENIRRLTRFLVSNSSSEFTYRALKSVTGIERVQTISHWLSLLEDSFLLFKLERFSPKLREQFLAPKKIYTVDNGIITSAGFRISENKGKLMENLVAVELKRRCLNEGVELYYFKDYQQREVDFVVREGLRVKQLIQVTYASGKDEIEQREIKSLLKASELLRCKNLLVITWDYEGEEEFKGKRISFVPLWKWLLNV